MGQYRCHTCDKLHEGPPTAYGADAPDLWYELEEPERSQRFDLGSDTAVLDGEHFFLRGRIEIPIHGESEPFAWGVWITMGEENFDRALLHWETPGREHLLEPTVGFLSTQLKVYPDTINLKGRIHVRPIGLRPGIELEPTDHPLALEQRVGISKARVEEIASLLLHNSQDGA